MFLFIIYCVPQEKKGFSLNTLHVLIYQRMVAHSLYCGAGLNTLHVLIYREEENLGELYKQMFKYITCSYLSCY